MRSRTSLKRVTVLMLAVAALVGACRPTATPNRPLVDADTEARALQILRDGLHSDEFWPSIHAAEGLTLAGHGAEVIDYLQPLLDTVTDDQQRCGVARELVRAGDTSAVSILVGILRSPDEYAHTHAAESLLKVGRVGDVAAMRAVYRSDDAKQHLMAAGALARSGDAEALEAIRTAYDTGEGETMQIAAWLLGRLGDESDIARLRNRIDDAPAGLVRAYVQHSLAALGDPEGLQMLAANLKSDDPAIRTYAATFAGDTGRPDLIPLLKPLLDDPHADARYRAAQSLLVLHIQQPDSQ